MVVCLGEELHATRPRELLETLDNLGSITVELLQHGAGQGEGHLEFALRGLDGVEKDIVHRQIALACDPLQDGPVGEVIVVVRVFTNIEEPVLPEPCRLMDLKIQTY